MQKFWKINACFEQGGKSYFYEFAKRNRVTFEAAANKINAENLESPAEQAKFSLAFFAGTLKIVKEILNYE